MSQPKIFLVDFCRTSGVSGELSKILRSSHGDEQIIHVPATELDSWRTSLGELISDQQPELMFLIVPPRPAIGLEEVFRCLRMAAPFAPVILVSEDNEPPNVFSLMQMGPADFITTPLRPVDVLPRVWRFLGGFDREEEARPRTLREKFGLQQLIGESPAFLAQVKKIPIVARCEAGVLITGETGTGKEMFARAIHYLGPRAHKPFVPINCGAIPVDLLENEIFGHAKGAFTGASTSYTGLIGDADGGTIFLDEIDCLSLVSQVKLLRFLQDKQYRSVGSSKLRVANVRVIAATNVDIENAVEDGRFRRDLYYRLNVVPIVLPPLRERREDIPLLARHFLNKYARSFALPRLDLSEEITQQLLLHDWPGNVRELEHSIERAILLSDGEFDSNGALAVQLGEPDAGREAFKIAKSRVVSEFEKSYIKGLLLTYRGNISKSANAAKKNRRAFFQLIRKHGINVQNFR